MALDQGPAWARLPMVMEIDMLGSGGKSLKLGTVSTF